MAQHPGNARYRAWLPNSALPNNQLSQRDNSIQPVIFAPFQTPLHLAAPPPRNHHMLPMGKNEQQRVFLTPVNQPGGTLHMAHNLTAANVTSNTVPMPLYPLLFTVPGLQVPPPQMTHGSGQKIQSTDKDDIPNCGTKDMSIREKYQLWHQYKELLKKYNFTIVEINVFACFLIRTMRSLSELFPKKRFSEYITLALEKWTKTDGYGRRMFFRATKDFKEIEINDKMKTRITKRPHSEDTGRKKDEEYETPAQKVAHLLKNAEAISSDPSQKKRKMKRHLRKTPPEIRQKAIEKNCEIIEKLEEDQESSRGDNFDQEMMTYVNSLCDNPQFMPQVETIINTEFVHMILSSNATIDIEQFITKVENIIYTSEIGFRRNETLDTEKEMKSCREES